MKELFYKYLNDQCSPTEVRELLAYFNATENESVLRDLIIGSLENIDAEDEGNGSRWNPITDKIFAVIKTQIDPEKGKVVSILRRSWVGIAAAVVLVIGGFAVFNLINK